MPAAYFARERRRFLNILTLAQNFPKKHLERILVHSFHDGLYHLSTMKSLRQNW